MKIAFYILTFLVCGVAAYFSLSLKEMFESQQQVRIDTIQTNRNVAANADATDAEIVTRDAVLEEAKSDRAQATAALESAQATGRTLTAQLREVETNIESQEAEIAQLNTSIEEITNLLAEFGEDVTPATINDNIANLQRRRDELVQQREEIDELSAAAERRVAEQRAESERISQRMVERNAKLSLNATEAVISAVDNDWGFVVIGAGSNSGFSPQSAMIVQRDGRVIGRIRPSSIEPTQTIAEIDYSAMSPGVRLQPGDRVLLARPVAN